MYRAANAKPTLHPDDPGIVAVAADVPFPQARIPVVALDAVEALARIVLDRAVPVSDVTG